METFAIALPIAPEYVRPVPLHLDILDVGQGDGMVVWLPNGKVIMDLSSSKNKGIVTKDSFK